MVKTVRLPMQPLENIFMFRFHRLKIEIGDVRFHHVGQEQVREK
jgi:hypothetical protein